VPYRDHVADIITQLSLAAVSLPQMYV